MSSYIFNIESSQGKINPGVLGRFFNKYHDFVCDNTLKKQADNVFVGFSQLNTKGLGSKICLSFSEDSSCWGMLDGSIDNLQALPGSHQLQQNLSTTESILALYRIHGTSFLEKLQGRCVLIIADHAAKAIVLYRSSLGQIPLYYYASAERIIASSEERAIAAHPAVDLEVNASMLASIFSLNSSHPAGQTAYTQVSELLPGECLIWTKGPTSGPPT